MTNTAYEDSIRETDEVEKQLPKVAAAVQMLGVIFNNTDNEVRASVVCSFVLSALMGCKDPLESWHTLKDALDEGFSAAIELKRRRQESEDGSPR